MSLIWLPSFLWATRVQIFQMVIVSSRNALPFPQLVHCPLSVRMHPFHSPLERLPIQHSNQYSPPSDTESSHFLLQIVPFCLLLVIPFGALVTMTLCLSSAALSFVSPFAGFLLFILFSSSNTKPRERAFFSAKSISRSILVR